MGRGLRWVLNTPHKARVMGNQRPWSYSSGDFEVLGAEPGARATPCSFDSTIFDPKDVMILRL